MLHKRIVTLLLVIVLVISIGFAACTSGQSKTEDSSPAEEPATSTQEEGAGEEAPAQTANGEGLTGEFELQIFLDGYGEKVWKDAINGFQAENPDLNILLNMSETVNDQMNTRWMSDDPPDFIYLGGNLPVPQFIEDGKLKDLTDFFDTAKDPDAEGLIKDKLLEGMLVPEGQNNGLYRAPFLFNCWGTWYDAALFREHSIEPPNNFEELMTAGAQLKEAGIPLFCYTGVYSTYLTRGFLQPVIASEGGSELLNAVARGDDPEIYRSEGFLKVLGKYQEMIDSGFLLEGTVALDHTASQIAWLNHQAAMIPNGLWLEQEMADDIPDGFEMRFIPSVLQDADQKMTVSPQGVSVGIAEKAKNEQAAFAFLTYLYRDDVLKSFVEASGSPSAAQMDISNVNVSETTKSVINSLSDPNVQLVPQNPINLPSGIEKAFSDAVNAMAMGGINAEEASQRVYEAALVFLEEGDA